MRSSRVTPNTVGTPSDYNSLLNDASGAAVLLAHQMYGTIALPTNPTNTKTLTLDINGTNVVITFVTSIGSTAGNVLIGASAAATAANLIQLLLNPTITNSTQVAIGVNTSANVALINYINWSLSGTSITASSYNSILYAPATSFSASTTVIGGSYTASTMALYVEPGVVYVNGTEVYFAGGVSPTISAPVSHPRIDVLTLNSSGTLAWTTGTEASSPSAPTYPANQLPICELYNVVSETALYDNANQTSSQGYIYNDVRPFLMYPINLAAVPDSILPSATNTYNLGSSGSQWAGVYAEAFYASGVQIGAKFGGNGASGTLTITSGTTTLSASNAVLLLQNYVAISITGTGALAFSNPATTGTVVILRSQGNVTLTSSATPLIDLRGMGAAGGASSSATAGQNGSKGAGVILSAANGGGGPTGSGSGTAGAGLGSDSTVINLYINGHVVPVVSGAGGGSGGSNASSASGAGGTGAGGLYIEVGGAFNFTTSNGINASGSVGSASANSSSAGGGGGAAGTVIVLYNTLTANTGTILCSGGTGGSSASNTGGTGGSSTGGSSNGGAGGSYGGGGGGAGSYAGGNGSSGTNGTANNACGGGGGGGAGFSLVIQNTWFT